MMSLPLPTPTPSPGDTAFPPGPSTLTSTTAPGKNFTSRSELQQHYKSDWHRYNLKRREAGLPMLNERDFTARLEAAVALRKEREGREERSGLDHRKDKNSKKNQKKDKNKKNQQKGKGHKRKPAFAKREENETVEENVEDEMEEEEPVAETVTQDGDASSDMEEEEGPPEINPSQSLFDNHISPTPQGNLSYLKTKYSFYLPDSEYCIDVEGLLGYCNEKVRWGNLCLYCQKSFGDTEAVLKHMRDKRHCKILYERGVDQEEFDVFYDFSEANKEFLGESTKETAAAEEGMEVEDDGWEDVEDDEDGDEGEWEDASMKDEDDDLYEAYQSEIATHGFDITPLGELIFPDGRIVGHRGLARYYKQRFAPDRMERAAVRHAREAAGDRLYAGRVVNLYRLQDGHEEEQQSGDAEGAASSSTALATMGRMAGSIPTGRNGKGILVSAGEGGKGGFTSLSLYRYRAAVKKQRREDARGQRLQYRSQMNMNKMNKKGNNIMTGVVTALAPR
eukprot:CAMPEP_0183705326 /NCGR_PEP_ID=MMETSP0737-20130205/2458_1 /TAXON_ID=385413 /ORGANISM="Thalassiosira miniscula, Strain CCMP1093" /LENGTH=506 /DNA_ID=CAMNT_0025932463 /DNA_START=42 /DNA_END=1562 /DNA_ORIENTATION=-